jgi:hypothetical protein
MATAKKQNHVLKGNRTLDEKKVLTIRKDYESGKATARELAEKFKVSPTTIFHIVNHKTWRNI